VPTAPYDGQSTVTTSRRRSGIEASRLSPHIQKNLAQKIFGKRLMADEPKEPAIDRGSMPSEQGLHSKFVASGNPLDQDLV
jgi:hypothetical protein